MTDKTRLPRLAPADRSAWLLNVALAHARKVGYVNISRKSLAGAAGCSTGLITHRFGTMDDLREELMREAVKQKDLIVIAQGIAAKDAIAMRAPKALREEARQAFARQ